jgi:hypothetical protein
MMNKKTEKQLEYIAEALKKHFFCLGCDCDDEAFIAGVNSFLFAPPGHPVKKVIGAFKTTNNPNFKEFKGDTITPQIFNKVADFMRGNFPHYELFNMRFEELRGPASSDSEN